MSLTLLLTRILFVGHSLIGPDLPPMVQGALTAMGHEAQVEAQIINGAPLSWNWEHSETAEGVNSRAMLAGPGTDVLVLTEAQPLQPQIDWNDSAGKVADFAKLARKANPATRVFLYETWPSLNTGTPAADPADPAHTQDWQARVAAELSLWQGIADEAAKRGAGEVRLIPAGQAMLQLAQEIDAGKVPGMSSIREAFSDDIHPNGKGLYLIAMTHAAAISGQSPEGLPPKLTRLLPDREAAISPELALAMQRIAWETVEGLGGAAPADAGPAGAMADESAMPGIDTPAAGASPDPQSATASTEAAATEPTPDLDLTPAPAPLSLPPPGLAPAVPAVPAAAAAEAEPPASPAPMADGIVNPDLALGLAGVEDWSVQQPFLDIMKTARPWTGHLPGQWGGWDYARIEAGGYLDAEGWPMAIPPGLTGLSTLVLTDLPEDAMGVAGRYVLRYQGRGVLRLDGRAQIVAQEPGKITFDYTPGPGAVVLTISVIDPVEPLRAISIVREDRLAALDAGQVFNPDWLGRIRGVKMIRFMDWMRTNDSTLSRAVDRPKPGDFSWAVNGVPMEVMVALANELGADPWFTIPHLAEDDLVRDMARIAADGLNPGRVAWVEFSNEVWNWQFAQASWAEEQGRARWGQDSTWVQYYALRASEVADIWAETFADPSRLVRVIAVQTGWLGLEEQILDAPLVMAEGKPTPSSHFDAYAVTGYFAAMLGSDEKAAMVRDWLSQGEDKAMRLAAQELRDGSVSGKDEDTLARLTGTIWPYHKAVARAHGLRLAMYEGGTHVVGLGAQVEDAALTDFFIRLNYSPYMADLYADLLAAWAKVGEAPFNAFVDVLAPAKWGSWGALRHLGDDNPRWQVLRKGCQC